MPLTPDANLGVVSRCVVVLSFIMNILDQLLGLHIVHAMDTSDTVTSIPLASCVLLTMFTMPSYPTERTRPVSAKPASSCTPRILCSRMEETSVGEAFASAA